MKINKLNLLVLVSFFVFFNYIIFASTKSEFTLVTCDTQNLSSCHENNLAYLSFDKKSELMDYLHETYNQWVFVSNLDRSYNNGYYHSQFYNFYDFTNTANEYNYASSANNQDLFATTAEGQL